MPPPPPMQLECIHPFLSTQVPVLHADSRSCFMVLYPSIRFFTTKSDRLPVKQEIDVVSIDRVTFLLWTHGGYVYYREPSRN